MDLAIWSSAEYFVGIIAGSIPPCRAFVLQMANKIQGKTSSNEESTGVMSPRSGYFYLLPNFSRISNAFSRNREQLSSETSRGPGGSKSFQKDHTAMEPWNVLKVERALSQDSGRESILPRHSMSGTGANPDTGIWKTVDIRVGTSGDDGGLKNDNSVQR